MREREYRRLTRSRRSRGKSLLDLAATRASLWLGKDHLLSVDIRPYTEEYKRFYFKDIQAITICKSRRREIWNIALSILLFVWLITFLYLAPVDAGPGTLRSLQFLLLVTIVPLVVNNVRGSTCTVHLRTAVQVKELPSLSRIPRTRRVLDRIRPLIVAAQRELAPEDALMRYKEMVQEFESASSATSPLNLSR